MARDDRTRARVAAYRLMEAAQGEDHQAAADGLASLAAAAHDAGWDDVAVLAQLGLAMYAILRPTLPTTISSPGLDELVEAAEGLAAPALLAHALGLRAVLDGARGASEALLRDAARALVLLDDPHLPALDACTALVAVAAAYNGQSLWELADEIYARAAELSPRGEEPIQSAAIAVNRVLIPLEWASALLEEGDPAAASEQFARALAATDAALATPGLPELWREELLAAVTGLRLYLHPPLDPGPLLAEAAARTVGLREHDDVEMLPLVEALVGLALLRMDRAAAAYEWSNDAAAGASVVSVTTGSRTFPAWVRATVLMAHDPQLPAVVPVWREYASMLAAQRREARRALLSAARSHLAGERLRTEHVRLRHEVASDALTALANRRAFDAWVRGARPVAQPTGLVLLDLDDFKAVNDSHGHSVGDEVLRRVGRLVARHVRPQDLALRLGGDEFAVILEADVEDRPGGPDVVVAAMATAVRDRADALREALATEPWSNVATGLTVTAAIGVAVDMVADATGAQQLYRSADEDLYRGKAGLHAVERASAGEAI